MTATAAPSHPAMPQGAERRAEPAPERWPASAASADDMHRAPKAARLTPDSTAILMAVHLLWKRMRWTFLCRA